MRMLEKLRNKISSIENEWERGFVESLIAEMENGRDFKAFPISALQFSKLVQIDNKYEMAFQEKIWIS